MESYRGYFQSPATKSYLSSSPALMESIDNPSLISMNNKIKTGQSTHSEISKLSISSSIILDKNNRQTDASFLIINEKEQLRVPSLEEFLRLLRCDESDRVKVVSIFGNTGDGKSYTLNECFFGGREVFGTSDEQESCTIGAWMAYDPRTSVICVDTEGLLGATCNENQRTRLLLKVLAISDIIIYRTRSERLHRDMFTFLGTASRAYAHHFYSALQSMSKKTELNGALSSLGPAVIIFHETRHTKVLKQSKSESPEDVLRSKFAKMNLDIEAYSSLKYIGIQTVTPPTNFRELQNAISVELDNTAVRSSRSPRIVYLTLKALNDKFSSNIEASEKDILFPDEYFTCPIRCLSCENRCSCSMGHLNEGLPHNCSSKCKYQHQHDNCIYVCKQCHANGKETIVTPEYSSSTESSWFAFAKYAWSGYVIECPQHGEIYRSRQFWYGNANPEMKAVRMEIRHVWPDLGGEKQLLTKYNVFSMCCEMAMFWLLLGLKGISGFQSMQNSAQRMIDGVSYLSEAVYSASSEPTKYVSSWVADKIAPRYWELNAEIKHCAVCKSLFGADLAIHHCRACGKGVCKNCSTSNMPVPERGWLQPVRVCDTCADTASLDRISECSDVSSDDAEIRARRVSEAVINTISSVACVLEYPKSIIKDTARPAYWVPDSKVIECCVCGMKFANAEANALESRIHHCRDCGEGVCWRCSKTRRPVPHRGWEHAVRVCDNCVKKD